jgi:hypothetical protein
MIIFIIIYFVTDFKNLIKASNEPYDEAEFRQATEDYKIAYDELNNADADFIDIAIYKVKAAEERFNQLLKIKRSRCKT